MVIGTLHNVSLKNLKQKYFHSNIFYILYKNAIAMLLVIKSMIAIRARWNVAFCYLRTSKYCSIWLPK